VRRLLFDPEILWGFEVIPEDRDNLLNLIISVLIYEKTCVWLHLLGLGIHTHFHLELTASGHLVLVSALC
jgi:hypothetical protein